MTNSSSVDTSDDMLDAGTYTFLELCFICFCMYYYDCGLFVYRLFFSCHEV